MERKVNFANYHLPITNKFRSSSIYNRNRGRLPCLAYHEKKNVIVIYLQKNVVPLPFTKEIEVVFHLQQIFEVVLHLRKTLILSSIYNKIISYFLTSELRLSFIYKMIGCLPLKKMGRSSS
jgi:hypothetical protein